MLKNYFRPEELAAYFKVSQRVLRSWEKEKGLRSVKILYRKFYKLSEVVRFIESFPHY